MFPAISKLSSRHFASLFFPPFRKLEAAASIVARVASNQFISLLVLLGACMVLYPMNVAIHEINPAGNSDHSTNTIPPFALLVLCRQRGQPIPILWHVPTAQIFAQ